MNTAAFALAGIVTVKSECADTAAVAAVAPANTGQPSTSGTTRDGETLTADPGSWSGTTPISHAYQWRRCDASGGACVDVPGANASKYTLVTADASRTMRVTVTATNVVGSSSATSAPSAVIRQKG